MIRDVKAEVEKVFIEFNFTFFIASIFVLISSKI